MPISKVTTGSITDSVAIDTNTLVVDGTNNRVGIGTSSPVASSLLTLKETNAGGDGAELRLINSSTTVESATQIVFTNTTTDTADSAVIKAVRTASGQDFRFSSDGSERLRIDSSGRVTMPYQPSFRATGNNSTYTTTSPIPFPSVQHNIGSHFSTGTNRFTAPIAGTYAFHAHIGFVYSNTSNGWSQVEIRKNGVQVAYSYAQASSVPNYAPCSVSALVELNANDYIDVRFANSNTQYYNGGNESQFSGHLVS